MEHLFCMKCAGWEKCSFEIKVVLHIHIGNVVFYFENRISQRKRGKSWFSYFQAKIKLLVLSINKATTQPGIGTSSYIIFLIRYKTLENWKPTKAKIKRKNNKR